MVEDLSCRVGVIGAGYTAREHIKAFQDVPGVQIHGICSRTRSRAELAAKEFDLPWVFDSPEELCRSGELDLVVVAVSELSLKAVCRECFEFPCTVLMEKPPGIDLSEAKSIEDAATSMQRNALVALNRRFYSSTQTALQSLNEQQGTRFVHVQDQQDLASEPVLQQPEAIQNNWMYANSIHVIDLLRTFGRGEVTEVRPVWRWKASSPGVVLATIKFDSGDVGIYEGIWSGPGPWSATITTAPIRWELRPLESACYQMAGTRTRQEVALNEWDSRFKPGFRSQAEMAVRSALGLRSESINLTDAVKTMRLISRIFEVN